MENNKGKNKKHFCCVCGVEITDGIHRWMCDECKRHAAKNRALEKYWRKKQSVMTFIAKLSVERAEKRAMSNVYISMENGKWFWKSKNSKVRSTRNFKTYKECRRDALEAFL